MGRVRETWVQSQVKSYQRLLKWYLIPPCLILSNIRYVSRVKWSNPGKGVAPSTTPRYRSYWKGSLLVTLDSGRQVHFYNIYIYIYSWEDKGMCKIIARPEFELAYSDSAVHRFNHYTTSVQSWTSPGSNTPQDTNCTATCPLSRKLFKLDEPDMQDTAGEVEMNS